MNVDVDRKIVIPKKFDLNITYYIVLDEEETPLSLRHFYFIDHNMLYFFIDSERCEKSECNINIFRRMLKEGKIRKIKEEEMVLM